MIMQIRAVATASEVTLSWSHDESGPPTAFLIESRVNAGDYGPAGSVPYVAGQTEYSVVDDTAVAGIQYRVAAVNSAGQAAWVESNVPTFPPNPVTNVVASV